jgi:outer membrane protein assembly factor BamD
LAAANRFRTVIEKFETTSHTPEALHRLVEVYLLLGVKEQAEHYAAVLGHNFPESKWYKYSYNLLRGKKIETTDNDWWKF